MRRKELMPRALAAGLAVMQAGTLVAPAPISVYAAELDMEEESSDESEETFEESGEVEETFEEASGAEETDEAEVPSEAEETDEVAELESEESGEVEELESEEADEVEESEESGEAEETGEAEESKESDETDKVEESTESEETSEAEETGEAEESEESNEIKEVVEEDPTVPAEDGIQPDKGTPAEAPTKAPEEAKVYKITVIDILVDEDGNELNSETRFVDELEEGEEYAYNALDDEGLTVVGESEYTGICDGDLTIEFKYTMEDMGIEPFANFRNYIYVTDEFYDVDGTLLSTSSRKFGYNDFYAIPTVNTVKNNDYEVTAVILISGDDEYDVTNGISNAYGSTDYPYDSATGTIALNSVVGRTFNEVVIKYTAKSEAAEDTVTVKVIDEFYDIDQTTVIERRVREEKEVPANRICSFSSIAEYNYYLLSNGVQHFDAETDGEIVFKYAKYITITVNYKDTEGNVFYSDTEHKYKYGEGYSIEPKLYYVEEKFSKFAELEGIDSYTGTATSDLTIDFVFSKPDTVTLNITYQYYDIEGGILQGTNSEAVQVKKGGDYTPADSKYYGGGYYKPVSEGLSNVQDNADVTMVYVKKGKYKVTGIFTYCDKDGNQDWAETIERDFDEGVNVILYWDSYNNKYDLKNYGAFSEGKYLLTSGDKEISNLQSDTTLNLTFTEGCKIEYRITDGSSLNQLSTKYVLKGGTFEVPECPAGYEWVEEPQAIDNIQGDMELTFKCRKKSTEYTVTYHIKKYAVDGTLEDEYDEVKTCVQGDSIYAPNPPSGYAWVVRPDNVFDYRVTWRLIVSAEKCVL